MRPDVTYASYLLRLWQVRNDTQVTWVAAVRSTVTGEERRFPSMQALLNFLQGEFGAGEAADGDAMLGQRGESGRDA